MRLVDTVTFASAGLDRAAHLRKQSATLFADAAAGVIAMWRGKPLVQQSGERPALLRLAADHALFDGLDAAPVLLGLDAAGAPVFARDISAHAMQEGDNHAPGFHDQTVQRHPSLPGETGCVDLRQLMAALAPAEAELAAVARAVIEWHRTHPFCPACGGRTFPADAGWERRCEGCDRRHFPRTEPVVIVLVTHGNDVLLGRSPGWPEGMYSLLAGFVEAGETIEAAARREVFEESAVALGDVRYLASQPWPFPASLMIGCRAEALGREIRVDPQEIEDARWFSRQEVLAARRGAHPLLKPARPGAIAHFLLSNWLADRLD
ncbi:NAD(+) diphosphatase [Poseidonocella sedimentorum]|uniref:NAD(+) diphosphatase n=1 Tax=Poseidonocella sedimentorum TaxID=871652 RepID=A0A1I6DUF8_9RHOB|nr:NAD(+) diphosphatase [Poseidonocella sedimentorum]SFR08938.1 NAD+ diphosphatase [Poseidonocella sedimentorum]